jgi:hypothetical protein
MKKSLTVNSRNGMWRGREFYKSTSQFESCIYVRKVNTGKFLLKEKEVFASLFAKKYSGLQVVTLGTQKKAQFRSIRNGKLEQNVEVYCAVLSYTQE